MARWFKIMIFLLIANLVFETVVALNVFSTNIEGINVVTMNQIYQQFKPDDGDGSMSNWMSSLPNDPLNYLAGFVINGFTILTRSIYNITIGAFPFYTHLLELITSSPSVLYVAALLTTINYVILFFGIIEFARGPVGMT